MITLNQNDYSQERKTQQNAETTTEYQQIYVMHTSDKD